MSPHTPARVSIIIPVLNGEDTIGECLRSIVRSADTAEPCEVVVVDNGSTDGTPAIVGEYPVRCVREARRGLSHARNRGIEEARGEVLVFTDADCLATTRWLRELLAAFEDGAVSAAAGEVVAYPATTRAERYVARRKPLWQQWTARGRVPWFLIGNSAFRREVFERIGGFDARFTGAGCEDIDFSWRFFGAGLRLRQCPRAVVFHRHRVTAGGFFRQQVRNGRGQALLCRKYGLPWGWRDEAAAWLDLGAGAWRLARTAALGAVGREPSSESVDPYFEFVRRVAQRAGFLHGAVSRRGGAPAGSGEREWVRSAVLAGVRGGG